MKRQHKIHRLFELPSRKRRLQQGLDHRLLLGIVTVILLTYGFIVSPRLKRDNGQAHNETVLDKHTAP